MNWWTRTVAKGSDFRLGSSQLDLSHELQMESLFQNLIRLKGRKQTNKKKTRSETKYWPVSAIQSKAYRTSVRNSSTKVTKSCFFLTWRLSRYRLPGSNKHLGHFEWLREGGGRFDEEGSGGHAVDRKTLVGRLREYYISGQHKPRKHNKNPFIGRGIREKSTEVHRY